MSPERDRRRTGKRGGGLHGHRASGQRTDEVVAGRRAVAEAVRAGRATEVLIVSSNEVRHGLRNVLDAARDDHVPVRTVPRTRLDDLAADHQGVVALVATETATLTERDLASFPFDDDAIVVVLDGITDPQNLGAAARSAEACGTAMLITRTRRAADVTAAAVRASAGALLHLPHARVANIARAIERLQDAGFWVVGLDERAEGTVYDGPSPSGKIAVVVGSEGAGMTRLVRERCDALVALPMWGRVGSLNAAASLAAVLYAFVIPSRRGRS